MGEMVGWDLRGIILPYPSSGQLPHLVLHAPPLARRYPPIANDGLGVIVGPSGDLQVVRGRGGGRACGDLFGLVRRWGLGGDGWGRRGLVAR